MPLFFRSLSRAGILHVFSFASRYVIDSGKDFPKKSSLKVGISHGLTLTPTASGTAETLAGLSIPQELFEAIPFAQLDGPGVVLVHFILVGHPLIDF